jgi:hypothetical protein
VPARSSSFKEKASSGAGGASANSTRTNAAESHESGASAKGFGTNRIGTSADDIFPMDDEPTLESF